MGAESFHTDEETDIFFSCGASARFRAMVSPHRGFAIILRHTTIGGTPVNECSARRRGLYLTTRQIQRSQQTNIRSQAKFPVNSPNNLKFTTGSFF